MAKKKKNQSILATMKKTIKSMKYWYVADENGQVQHTKRIVFEGILTLPLVIFEGVKVGFYSRIANVGTGFQVFAEGLITPAYKVHALRHAHEATGFGSEYSGFDPGYLGLMLLGYAVIFASLYMTAERNRNKSYKKDGNMKFGRISEFNEKMAYCDETGEPVDPPENSYEPGNMILSQNIRYSLEPKGTNTYSNALVIGVTGCGKSFTYVKPNVLQMNSSYVITDPKGELTHDLGAALMRHGYRIKLFNLSEQTASCKYNPFHYIRSEADVVTMVNTFLENTKEEDAGGGDPFFPLAEKNFYLGLCFYIYTVYKDQPEKQTFKTLYELYQSADEQEVMLKKGEAAPESKFDEIFRKLAQEDPANPALPYYATFKKGSSKTKQSILTSVGVKLWFLSVGTIANLLSGDTLELEKLGDRKTALFIVIPSEVKTYKFLSAILFTQLFETLYYVGNTLNEKSFLLQHGNCVAFRSDPFIPGTKSEDEARFLMEQKREMWKDAYIEDDNELIATDPEKAEYFNTPNERGFKPFPAARLVYNDKDTGERRVLEEFQSRAEADMVYEAVLKGEIVRGKKSLVNHVRFMLDEFFSLGKITDFDLKIATFRSLRISCDIIVQSIAQLKEMYEDREAKIVNNCNVQILLGAASNDDCQYFSDLMGQTTVRSESASVDHKGLIQGVSGTNISDGAQLLMRPEDIRTMSKDRCLVIVNTTKPLIDEKYSSLDHPRWGESFSSFDANSQKNEFQFQRLFYVEQDESNRVVTILSSIGQTPTIGQNDNKMPKHEPIKGKRPDEQENRIGIDPNPGLSQEERQRRYEEAKRKMAAANEAVENKSASENIETNLKDKANSYGEVNIADVTGYGVDLSKLLIEVTSGSGEWEVADGDTPGTKRIQPTNDNAIANALKKGNVKKEQIHTDPNDVFDLW